MQTITDFMTDNHLSCDDKFAEAESAAVACEWAVAEPKFKQFQLGMAKHFRMEEDIIFPTLLSAGGPNGPVQVMCMEHAQMNSLIDQMAIAVANKDSHEYSGLSETLLIVMQQHNLKEEQMLYPIADHFLATQRIDILEIMRLT